MQESGPNLQILERSAASDPAGNTSPQPDAGVRWIVGLALWFGLFTGLVEVALLGAKRYVPQDFLGVSPMVVWMAPLGYIGLFMSLGLVFALAGRRTPTRRLRFAALAVFGTLSTFSILTLFSQLHVLAILVLGAGIGVQGARLSQRHESRFATLTRIMNAYMAFAVLTLGVTVHGTRTLRERRAIGSLPSPTTGAPNILLLVLDTVRGASVGLGDRGKGTTPNLRRLADEGVYFSHALATAPWTLPSHSSMFTGHYPAALSASWEAPLDETFTTLAEVLHARGYATAGFVANATYAGWESGLARGFAHYQDYEITLGQVLHSSGVLRWLRQRSWFRNALGVYEVLGRRDAPAVNAAFLRWFAANRERPVFAFLNYYDAHAPYLPPEPYRSEFGTPGLRQNPLLLYEAHIEGYPPEAVRHELEAYEGAIAYLDSQLGPLIDELERTGALENTLLIITSDHGEEFDEHGRLGHGNSLYMPVLQVPLIMRFAPTIPAGTHVTTPVSLVDVPATILELLGIVEHGMPGTSLARTWTGEGHARPVLSEEYDMQSVLIDDYHYIMKGEDRAEELYAVGTDEWEQENLAVMADMRPLIACLRAASNHRFAGANECTTNTEDSQ